MIKLLIPIDKTKKYKSDLRGFWYSQESKKLYYDYIITKRYKNSNKNYLEYLKQKYNQESLFYLQNGQAKIFYNPGKTEVLNRRLYFTAKNKKDLKPLLKKLIKKYNGCTVYDLSFGCLDYRYKIEVWIKSDKIEKRKKLIYDLIKKNIPSDFNRKLTIKIIDKDDTSRGFSRIKSCFNPKTGKTKSNIYIDLIALKDRIKSGYSDDYYKGRKNKLNFVLHNKKLALHFVILHELGHIVNTSFNHNSDVYADDYAISELKNQGLLKEIRYIEDWSCD